MRKEAGIHGFGVKGQRGGFRKLNKGGTFKKRILCVFGGKFFINYFISTSKEDPRSLRRMKKHIPLSLSREALFYCTILL